MSFCAWAVVPNVPALVPAAGVARELDAVAHDANTMVVGAHVDGVADELGRDGVGIGAEANTRLERLEAQG